MLARIALFTTLGTLCSVLGFHVATAEFWCFLALFWAADTLGRYDGFNSGMQTARDLLVKAQECLTQAQNLREAKGHPRDTEVNL